MHDSKTKSNEEVCLGRVSFGKECEVWEKEIENYYYCWELLEY